MADLEHFFRNYPERSKHTWYLSGESRRGVELVVDMLREMVEPLPSEFLVFHLRDVKLGDVVDALALQTSFPRLVVVRDVELLDSLDAWDKLLRFSLEPELTYVVYVDGTENPRKGLVPEVFRWVAKIGRFIECRPLSDEKLLAIVKYVTGVGDRQAERLLARIGNDLDFLLAELRKFQLAGLSVGDIVVLDTPPKSDPIVDLFDRPIRKPFNIPLSRLLGLVELELVREAAVLDGIRDGLKFYEIATSLNIPPFAIDAVIDRAKKLDPVKLAARLSLVTKTQHLLRLGAFDDQLLDWFFEQWRRL